MSSSMVRKLALSMIVCCTLLAVGCDKVKGTYTDDHGAITINFKGGGKADVTFMGMTNETTYEVNGDKVTIHSLSGGKENAVMTINSDGSLNGGFVLGTLKKKS